MQDSSTSIMWITGHPVEDVKRNKHIQLRYHHIREKIARREFMVEKISSSDMTAEFLTKLFTSESITEANDRE